MIVLADNDILSKLASCDLFEELLSAFGTSHDDIRILKTARFALTGVKQRKRIGDAAFARLVAFMELVRDVDGTPDDEEMIALTEQPRIDSGEAVLFSICPRLENAVLFTGDKRSLKSLNEASANDATCTRLCQRLAGKIVCFEQIVQRIVKHAGFEEIRHKLIAGRECDKTLAIVIGSGLDTTETSLREGLESYINDLRKFTGLLLQ